MIENIIGMRSDCTFHIIAGGRDKLLSIKRAICGYIEIITGP